jgi:hypothetical protein
MRLAICQTIRAVAIFLSLGGVGFSRPAGSVPKMADPGATAATIITVGQRSGTVRLQLGATHGLHSVDADGNAEAVRSAKATLHSLFRFQNVWMNGQGSGEIEPQPGVLRFARLDARMQLVRSTGGIPIITLCAAPEWMRKLNTEGPSIDPSHYADFAALARQVALRYPDVKYFLVWSELKGFWNRQSHQFDSVEYTKFYNLIYDTLKRISPDIEIGGPYVHIGVVPSTGGSVSDLSGAYGSVMQSSRDAIQYWLQNKHGADFLAIDGAIHGNPDVSANPYPADWFASAKYFRDVDKWLQSVAPQLPIWWSEWYAVPGNHASALAQFGHDRQNALMIFSLFQMMSDVAVALRWKPEGDATLPYEGDQESVWSDTRSPGGGRLFPFGKSIGDLNKCFPPGATLYSTQVSRPKIAAFASSQCVALINTSETPIENVIVEGKHFHIPAYGVIFANR